MSGEGESNIKFWNREKSDKPLGSPQASKRYYIYIKEE